MFKQDASTSTTHSNGISAKGATFSGGPENLPLGSNCADLFHSIKENEELHLNGHAKHLHLGAGTAGLLKTENVEMTNNHSLEQQISVLEKKRTRNIGPKSKRLLIDNDDAIELRLTWEEAQDLLRPPPSVKPSIVTIEDQVFEEYDVSVTMSNLSMFLLCTLNIVRNERCQFCRIPTGWLDGPVFQARLGSLNRGPDS